MSSVRRLVVSPLTLRTANYSEDTKAKRPCCVVPSCGVIVAVSQCVSLTGDGKHVAILYRPSWTKTPVSKVSSSVARLEAVSSSRRMAARHRSKWDHVILAAQFKLGYLLLAHAVSKRLPLSTRCLCRKLSLGRRIEKCGMPLHYYVK